MVVDYSYEAWWYLVCACYIAGVIITFYSIATDCLYMYCYNYVNLADKI